MKDMSEASVEYRHFTTARLKERKRQLLLIWRSRESKWAEAELKAVREVLKERER